MAGQAVALGGRRMKHRQRISATASTGHTGPLRSSASPLQPCRSRPPWPAWRGRGLAGVVSGRAGLGSRTSVAVSADDDRAMDPVAVDGRAAWTTMGRSLRLGGAWGVRRTDAPPPGRDVAGVLRTRRRNRGRTRVVLPDPPTGVVVHPLIEVPQRRELSVQGLGPVLPHEGVHRPRHSSRRERGGRACRRCRGFLRSRGQVPRVPEACEAALSSVVARQTSATRS